MESVAVGDLVVVSGTGAPTDGLVFDTPSRTKAVVAVMDPTHGPVFRTVNPRSLAPRAQPGPHDPAHTASSPVSAASAPAAKAATSSWRT